MQRNIERRLAGFSLGYGAFRRRCRPRAGLHRRVRTGFLVTACLAAALTGCGGATRYPVEGTILLGDSPLELAAVTFIAEAAGDDPAEQAEVGFARTDADGRFVILGSGGQPGLPAGAYRVRVSTLEEDDYGIVTVPERVPARYNAQSELRIDVAADSGPFDFVLDPTGPVFQPGREY